jgi:hypothetical protein
MEFRNGLQYKENIVALLSSELLHVGHERYTVVSLMYYTQVVTPCVSWGKWK